MLKPFCCGVYLIAIVFHLLISIGCPVNIFPTTVYHRSPLKMLYSPYDSHLMMLGEAFFPLEVFLVQLLHCLQKFLYLCQCCVLLGSFLILLMSGISIENASLSIACDSHLLMLEGCQCCVLLSSFLILLMSGISIKNASLSTACDSFVDAGLKGL